MSEEIWDQFEIKMLILPFHFGLILIQFSSDFWAAH